MLLLSNVIVARFELDGKSVEVRGRQTQWSGLIKFYYNIIIIQYYYCKFYNELDDGKSVEEGRDKARQRSGQGPHSSLGANGNDNGHHWNKIIKI